MTNQSTISSEEGLWNLELFRVWLSKPLIGRITSIPPPHPLVGPDKIAWMGTSLGCFSMKSAWVGTSISDCLLKRRD